MIKIDNIHSGWLNLHIGDKSFCVSYLTDVKEELNEILTLEKEGRNRFKLLYFDGEGKELYLTVRREYNDLIIIWELCDYDAEYTLARFEFNYEEFNEEWLNLWNTIQDDYIKHFSLDTIEWEDQ